MTITAVVDQVRCSNFNKMLNHIVLSGHVTHEWVSPSDSPPEWCGVITAITIEILMSNNPGILISMNLMVTSYEIQPKLSCMSVA